MRGTARLADDHTVMADTANGQEVFEADAILLSTGAARGRPRGHAWTPTGSSPPGTPIPPRSYPTTWWSWGRA